MVKKYIFASLAVVFGSTSLSAQKAEAVIDLSLLTDRSISQGERFYTLRQQTTSLGIGGSVLKDEYLSPLNYGGWAIQFGSESNRLAYNYPQGKGLSDYIWANTPRTSNRSWLRHRNFSVLLGQMTNPAGNARITRLEGQLSGSVQYRLYEGKWGRFYLGPGYMVLASGLYSSRNGNNPVSIDLRAALTLSAAYSYQLPIDAFPVMLRLSSRTSLLGLKWGQEFGESFYELYYVSNALKKRLGFTHLGNTLSQELRLTIDIPLFDRTVYSLGYRLNYQSSKYNELRAKNIDHAVLLGLTRYLQQHGGRSWRNNNRGSLPF